MHKRKSIFITGITGFLGSHIAIEAYKQGYHIVGLSNKRTSPKLLKQIKYTSIKSNISDIDKYKDIISKCSIIIHTAAIIESKNKNIFEINISATKKLYHVAIACNVEQFIFISSRSTIGVSDIPENSNENSDNFENHNFIDKYTQSKIEAEKCLVELNKNEKLKLLILCPTAIIGPNDERPTEIGKLINFFINSKIILYVDGKINLVDVRDLASFCIVCIKNGITGKFGIGNENTSISELIAKIKKMKKGKYLAINLNFWLVYFTIKLINKLLFYSELNEMINPHRVWRLKRGYSCFNSEKAKKILNKNFRKIENTINDIVNE